MNKLINTLIIVLFFFLNLPLKANNTMSVVDQSAYTGSVIEVEINLENTDNVAAFQLDVVLPEGFVYQEDNTSMEPDRIDGHEVGENLIDGNVLRIVSYANPTADYIGNDGVIARFYVETPATSDDYVFDIEDLVLSDTNGESVTGTAQSGTISLSDPSATDNVLIIHDASALTGEEVTIEVEVENEDEFTAFQFDIELPEGFSFAEGSASLTDRADGHDLEAGMVDGKLRFLSFSGDNNIFSGISGNVLTFNLQTAQDEGSYNITPEDISIADALGNNLHTGTQPGVVTLTEEVVPQFELTMAIDGSGTTDPEDGIHSFDENTEVNIEAFPAAGNEFVRWEINGVDELDNPTTVNMTEDVTATAYFEILTYTVSASAGVGGSIEPAGEISVEHGEDQAFIITPDEGFEIDEIIVDGTSVGSVEEYTFTDITQDHTIEAFFEVSAEGPNILIVHDVEAKVGEIIDVYVEIENADPFVAFQFDMILPGGFVYEEESVVLTGREADHIVQASMINENTLRVLSYSNSNAEFDGNNGNVAVFELQTPINAGTHQIEFDESQAVITHISSENIITGVSDGIITLQKATPEIVQWPEASSITYGEQLAESSLTGGEADVDGEFIFDNPEFEPVAGQYMADITFTPDDTDNFYSVSGQVQVDVEQKELTVINAVAQDKIYDGNTETEIEGAELDGVLEGDLVELENHTMGNFEQATVGENIRVLTNMLINGDDAGNYVLTQPELYADITHASLTVTANDIVKQYGVEHEFDGTEFVANPEPFGSDEVTSVTLESDGTPADAQTGEYIIYISDAVGVGLTNYDIEYENGIMDVTDKIILNIGGLTANDKDYDGTRDASIDNWGTLEGIDPEHPDVELDISTANVEFSQSGVGENLTVTVSGLGLTGADAEVYSIGSQTTTASIFAIPLSVTANDAEKVYGDDDPAFTAGYEGFVAGQDHNYLDGVLMFEREEGEDTGSYTITPSGLTSNNYEITFEDGLLTITQLSVEITADSKTKVYGEDDPDLTFRVTEGELVFDDDFAGELVREEGEDVGEYAILQGTVELNDNYNLNYISDDLVITAKTLVVTPGEDQYKVFEEPDPEITFTFDEEDLVGDDEITGELSREAGEDVGVYDITAGTLTAGNNYQLEIVQEVFTIYAQLTVEVNDSDAGSAIIVDGIDLYLTGEEATLEATANEGYHFVEWTVNGSFESDSPVYDYEMPGHNVTITANFAEDVETFDLTLTAVPEEAATFTGEGEYPEGDIVNITTGVNEGYAFMYWLDDEQVVSYEKDFAYEMPAEDTELIAHFSEESNDFENNIVIVGDVTDEPGETITIEVDVENEDPFTAFQMDFQLPEGFVLVENSPELSERAGNHSIASNVLEGNVFRVLAYSMTNEDFSGNQGMLLSFELETPGEEGTWELLAENVSLTNVNSQNVFTDSYPGNIVLEIPAETYTVIFVVEDEDGEQVNDAVVTFNDIENPEGDYVFENVEPGTYSYFVSADGYKEADGRIEVTEDDVFETIALEIDDTSIDIYEGFELMVYPNPVRNKLTVESGKNIEQVRIIDISGQVIIDKTIDGLHTEIFVNNLQTGIYFLQVQTEEGVRTHKIQVY